MLKSMCSGSVDCFGNKVSNGRNAHPAHRSPSPFMLNSSDPIFSLHVQVIKIERKWENVKVKLQCVGYIEKYISDYWRSLWRNGFYEMRRKYWSGLISKCLGLMGPLMIYKAYACSDLFFLAKKNERHQRCSTRGPPFWYYLDIFQYIEIFNINIESRNIYKYVEKYSSEAFSIESQWPQPLTWNKFTSSPPPLGSAFQTLQEIQLGNATNGKKGRWWNMYYMKQASLFNMFSTDNI